MVSISAPRSAAAAGKMICTVFLKLTPLESVSVSSAETVRVAAPVFVPATVSALPPERRALSAV